MGAPGPWPGASDPTVPAPLPGRRIPQAGPGATWQWQWGAPPPNGSPNYGPPNYGSPNYGPPPHGWQPPPPPNHRRRNWILVAVAAVILMTAAGGVWGFRYYQQQQELASIRTSINAFAEASDTADTKRLATLMCREEADQFTDDFDGAGGAPITPATRRAVDIGAITVTGDEATADVTRPPTPTATFRLKREHGSWKLCNPS